MSKKHRSKKEWVGFQMNELTVIEKIGEHSSVCRQAGKDYVYPNDKLLMRCSCGHEFETLAGSLIGNKPSACRGCSKMNQCVGLTSGSLTVVGFHRTRTSKRSVVWYDCICLCGGSHSVKADIFNIGDCFSCQQCRKNSKFIMEHGNRTPARYFKRITNGANRRKSTKGMPFDITIDFIVDLLVTQSNLCILSGLPISIEDGTASLDRIVNTVGYVKDNVQWVHRSINYMKNELDQDDFIRFCSAVHSCSG